MHSHIIHIITTTIRIHVAYTHIALFFNTNCVLTRDLIEVRAAKPSVAMFFIGLCIEVGVSNAYCLSVEYFFGASCSCCRARLAPMRFALIPFLLVPEGQVLCPFYVLLAAFL